MSNLIKEETFKAVISAAAYPMLGQIVPAEETNDKGEVVEIDLQLPPNFGFTKLEYVALKLLELHISTSDIAVDEITSNTTDMVVKKAGLLLASAHLYMQKD